MHLQLWERKTRLTFFTYRETLQQRRVSGSQRGFSSAHIYPVDCRSVKLDPLLFSANSNAVNLQHLNSAVQQGGVYNLVDRHGSQVDVVVKVRFCLLLSPSHQGAASTPSTVLIACMMPCCWPGSGKCGHTGHQGLDIVPRCVWMTIPGHK